MGNSPVIHGGIGAGPGAAAGDTDAGVATRVVGPSSSTGGADVGAAGASALRGGADAGSVGAGETGGANGDSNVFGSVEDDGAYNGSWDTGGIQVEGGGANGDSAAAGGSADGDASCSGSLSSGSRRGGDMRRGAAAGQAC
jgi:hypothetical protein